MRLMVRFMMFSGDHVAKLWWLTLGTQDLDRVIVLLECADLVLELMCVMECLLLNNPLTVEFLNANSVSDLQTWWKLQNFKH